MGYIVVLFSQISRHTVQDTTPVLRYVENVYMCTYSVLRHLNSIIIFHRSYRNKYGKFKLTICFVKLCV